MNNTASTPSDLRREALKGLLWMDFRRHRLGFLIGLPSIVIMALLVGLVENAGGPMFFWLCFVMAVGCGTGFGFGEQKAGAEEFSFALPPLRRDRYYVRFFLGVVFLLTLQIVGLAAGPLEWVRAGWELLGFDMSSYRAADPLWKGFDTVGFYALSIGMTYAVYAESYAISMRSESRCETTWIRRATPFIAGAIVVYNIDWYLMPGPVGYLTGVLGFLYAFPRTYYGARAFEKRSASFGAGGAQSCSARKSSLILALVLGLTVLLTAAVWVYMSNR